MVGRLKKLSLVFIPASRGRRAYPANPNFFSCFVSAMLMEMMKEMTGVFQSGPVYPQTSKETSKEHERSQQTK